MSFLDLILALYGGYFLYQFAAVKLHKKDFDPKLLLPRDLTLDKCKDREGLENFLMTAFLINGLLLFGFGAFSYFSNMGETLIIPSLVLLACLILYYIYVTKTAKKRYF